MIKQELRSTIKNLLPRIDKSNSFHDNVLDAAIERVLNQMISNLFLKGGQMEPFMKRYGDAVPLTVTTDAITGIDYTTLPAAFIPLPDKCSGVRNVYTIQMGGMTFYPMDAREADILGGNTYFSTVSNKIGYVVFPTKIEYFGMTAGIRGAGVRMDICIPFRVYADTDTVNIPGNASADLIKAVLEVLQVIQPADLKDNNTNVADNGRQ